MKGCRRSAVLLAVITLLLPSTSGYSKNSDNLPKAPAKHRKITQSNKPAVRLDSDNTYIVRPGDNLSRIARAHQTTVETLKSVNGLNSARINVGQELILPVSQTANTQQEIQKEAEVRVALNEQPAVASDFDSTYVVRRGDNLLRIARANQTTVEAIKSANGLKSTRIKAGQTLILPTSQSAVVQQGALKKAEVRAAQNEQSAIQHISQLKDRNLITEDESSSTAGRFIEAGFQMLGVRYRFSGGSEKTGFDCSGLVKSLFSKFNVELPRSSREQYKQGEKIDRDNLQIGDLVFFSSGGSRPNHVGVYIGDNKFIHAARKARKVIVSDLNKIWYTMRYLGARRIATLWGSESEPKPETDSPAISETSSPNQ